MAAVARLIVSVLLPTPPFQARSAMTFIGVPSHESSSVTAGRQTATQSRLPVHQQIYVHSSLLVWTRGRVGALDASLFQAHACRRAARRGRSGCGTGGPDACDQRGLVEPRPCRSFSGRPLPGATRLARDAAGALEASRAG